MTQNEAFRLFVQAVQRDFLQSQSAAVYCSASFPIQDLTGAVVIDVLGKDRFAQARVDGELAGRLSDRPVSTHFMEIEMYAKIICAIGLGSRERAERLLRTSQALLTPGGELTVVHVIERSPSGDESPDKWAVSVIGEAEEKLNALCKRLGIIASIDVRMGTASKTLLIVAKEKKADLIVLATHASDILDRIFGSTVEYVTRHAECSVLIDRAEKSDHSATTKGKGKQT